MYERGVNRRIEKRYLVMVKGVGGEKEDRGASSIRIFWGVRGREKQRLITPATDSIITVHKKKVNPPR